MKFDDKGRYISKRMVKEKNLPDAEDYCKEGWCYCDGCWNSVETRIRLRKQRWLYQSEFDHDQAEKWK
tara:strand:- start:452 stop:655 length:204 start_codon:yes stop_codon:yes gene_type:complete